MAVEPAANQLQIDLDGAEAVERFNNTWTLFAAHRITTGWTWTKTRSRARGHYHITVTMIYSRTLAERIALQCLLGSDLSREAHNYIRYWNDSPLPVVFFERVKP